MNHLNQVIVEGFASKSELIQTENERKTIFTLESIRESYDGKGKKVTEVTKIPCLCYYDLKFPSQKEFEIRLVGRFTTIDEKLYVIVEHLEIKK